MALPAYWITNDKKGYLEPVGAASSPRSLSSENRGEDAAPTARCIVAVDPRYFRPTEMETLLGDPSKAKEKAGWAPGVDDVGLDREVVTDEFGRVGVVGMNAADFGRGQKHVVGLFRCEEGFDCGLAACI